MVIGRYSDGKFAGLGIVVSRLAELIVGRFPLFGPIFDDEDQKPDFNYLVLGNGVRVLQYSAHLTIDAPDQRELEKIAKLLEIDPRNLKVQPIKS